MTQKANPSVNRTIEAYKTAGAIAYGGHGDGGWISPASSPTDISVQDPGIDETTLNAFAETSSGTSLDVTIDGGEAFIFGSWIAKDTTTTVTLSASTSGQTVYAGWNKNGSDDVLVGLNSEFSGATGDTDEKIPLFDFDTDGSGVTNVVDRRTIEHTIDARVLSRTNTVTSNYTTDGEQILFVDTSGGAVTVTLSSQDVDEGNNVIIVDSGGASSSNNITVATESNETINGSATATIETDYGAKAIASDGLNWYTSGAGGGGIEVEDDGVVTISGSTNLNFGADLSVTDDGDGSVTVDSTVSSAITVLDDGTSVSSSVDTLDFGGSDFGVTNPTTGEAEIALTNDSLTVSSGTALSGGGSVSLGGSTTLDVAGPLTGIDFKTAGDVVQWQTDANNDLILQNTTDAVTLLTVDQDTGDILSTGVVPNTALVNSSVTVNGGTGINGAGTISLGGSGSVSVGFGDDSKLNFGAAPDVSVRYDTVADDLRWQDEQNGLDRMALDRSTGDLTIEGTLSEGASL